MAEEIKYVFNADVTELNGQLNKVNKNLENTNNAANKTEDKLSLFGKATQKAANSFKKLGDTLKGGLGVGLAVKAFDSLTGAIMENQEVSDALSRGMIVIRAVAGQLVEEFKPLGEFLSKVFNDPLQALKDFGKLLYDNVVTRFEGLMELIPRLGNAISLLFEGEFKKAAQVATDAAGKFVLGIDNVTEKTSKAFDKLVEGATRVADAGKKAFDQSAAVVQAEKNVARLQVLYQGIVEKYDQMAEKQRQLRDDETKTIDERIASNKQLQDVLKEGEAEEKKNIQARIAGLNQQIAVNKTNVELQNERLALQQELTGVEAKYAGLMSETLTNEVSLKREALEIDKSRREASIEQMEAGYEAALAEKQAILDRTDLIQNETDRLIAAKQAEMDLRNTEIAQVQQLRDLRTQEFDAQLAQLTQGTAAYQDALNAKNNFLAESTAKEKTLQTGLQTYVVKSEAEIAKAKRASQMAGLEAVSQALSGVIDLVGAESKWGKSLAVGQAIINTYVGASKAIAEGGTFGPIIAAGVIASGLAQVRQITMTKLPDPPSEFGGGGGGDASASVPTPSFGPSVGIVGGQIGNNAQLAQAFGGVMRKPIKAYAVGQDMTTQQSLDRHISQNATLGK
jgi:hypothetical protein